MVVHNIYKRYISRKLLWAISLQNEEDKGNKPQSWQMKEGEDHYFEVHESGWLVHDLPGQWQVFSSLTKQSLGFLIQRCLQCQPLHSWAFLSLQSTFCIVLYVTVSNGRRKIQCREEVEQVAISLYFQIRIFQFALLSITAK